MENQGFPTICIVSDIMKYLKMTKEKAIDETVPVNEDEEYLKELKDKL